MQEQIKVPKVYLDMINQIFELEKKASALTESNSLQRNINRLKELFENDLGGGYNNNNEAIGFIYHNPIGEPYNETRTDCDASIAGTRTDNLVITEVIKPIIRCKKGGVNVLVQKAVVVAESK